MNYAVIGTGAIGGFYGALLQHAGFDVHFLLHSDFEQVRTQGLKVESVHKGDLSLFPVNAYSRVQDMPYCDVIIVSLKTYHNHLLKDMLPKLCRQESIVLLLQNGLGMEAEVQDLLPENTVLGGMCFICSNKVGPGHIKHLDYGSLSLGEYAGDTSAAGITRNLEKVVSEFQEAGIEVQSSDNLMKSRWTKLIWNMPFNGLSTVLRATTEEIMSENNARELATWIMQEVKNAAAYCGISIQDKVVDKLLDVTSKMVSYHPSMKLDWEKSSPLETQYIYWNPINKASNAGYKMIACRTLAQELEFLNRQIVSPGSGTRQG
mgnify:CR=1 FL=1